MVCQTYVNGTYSVMIFWSGNFCNMAVYPPKYRILFRFLDHTFP